MSDDKNTNYVCRDFYVDGMHCAACELLVEKKLKKHGKVKSVKANLSQQKVTIEGVFSEDEVEKLAEEFTNYVEKDGYKVSSTKSFSNEKNWGDFIYAIPIALFLIIIFVILQKIGLVNLVGTDNQKITYPVIFFIGVVASLSSCMAVVGGLVLSMAATYAKESKNGKTISQIMFHASRIVGFFIFGGILGIVGASFHISTGVYFALNIIIAIVMIILAINMMGVFPIFRNLVPRMPKFLSGKVFNISSTESANIITPLIIGAATFFLPCGFTQSMQLYALGTGNFISGAMTMFVFALGTFPALALVSFASISFSKFKSSGIFFKTAGIIVLFFAFINILGALAIAGIIPPILNL